MIGRYNHSAIGQFAHFINDITAQSVFVGIKVFETVGFGMIQIQSISVGTNPYSMTAVFVNGVEQVTADAVGSIWVVLVFFQCTVSDIIFTEPLACTAYDPQIVLTVNMEGVCIIGNGLFFCRREE